VARKAEIQQCTSGTCADDRANVRMIYFDTGTDVVVIIIRQLLFREPDGRQKGRFFSVLSVVCLLTWVFTGLVLDGSHLFLFMGIAFACTGVAESLPEDRRRPAGLLRLIGIGVLGIYLAVLVPVPELFE
jgi:hypothetical protein